MLKKIHSLPCPCIWHSVHRNGVSESSDMQNNELHELMEVETT